MCANSPRYRFRQGQKTSLISQGVHAQRKPQNLMLCLKQEIDHKDHVESQGQFQVHTTLTPQRDRQPQSEKEM